jgi:DNA-binding transcriptional MerR regulator
MSPAQATDLDGAAESAPGMRVDELARRAGVATTTVRLYQSKGLLPPPHLVGRTGYYDDVHLARLAVIARLQGQGFSLAGIATLLEGWERGVELSDLVGAEEQLGQLLGRSEELVLTAEELLAHFAPDALDPASIQRAASMGLVEMTDDGRFRVPDARFVRTGSALAALGVPIDVILDEWQQLSDMTDRVAERFAALFEDHLLPSDWRDGLDAEATRRLARTLGELRSASEQVLSAALDQSIAKLAAVRFADLLTD